MNDVFATELLLVADGSPGHPSPPSASEPVYTIGDLAKRFGLTLRALRFYENRGLLNPVRGGGRRLYGPKDVERLALIVKAKKLGLTLTAIQQLIVDDGEGQTLRLSHEACMAQIAILEGQLAEIEAALAELRAMCGLTGDRQPDRP
jgi:DNA-binding transcriptional MerR regulator